MYDKTPLPSSLRSVSESTVDRRADPRLPCSMEVSVQPISGKGCDLWWLAEIQDVSQHGIGMLSTRRFEFGAFVAIHLANLDNSFSQTKTARVMHVVQRGDRWFVGCALNTPLDAEEMAAFREGTH
jgi:hypothetical protein